MVEFKHDLLDLDGSSFRLLRLLPDPGRGVECEIFQAWLGDDIGVPYEALSYTWGSQYTTEYITINGKGFDVTSNLYSALRNLQHQETDRILWIDALCIDQSNDRERSHQVQQMGRIYSQAERVIFWLGESTYETDVFLDAWRALEGHCLDLTCNTWTRADPRWLELWSDLKPIVKEEHPSLETHIRLGLETLLNRSWWKRVWIIQEVANAKAALVCCGTKSVSARIFALAPILLEFVPEPHCQAVLDIVPGPSRKDSWWNSQRDLYTLLTKFRQSKASDERDMVYALIGISSDGRDDDRLRADYTISEHSLILVVTRVLFELDDCSYTTMTQFLFNLEYMDVQYLDRLLMRGNLPEIGRLLEKRGAHYTVDQYLRGYINTLVKHPNAVDIATAICERCGDRNAFFAALLRQAPDLVRNIRGQIQQYDDIIYTEKLACSVADDPVLLKHVLQRKPPDFRVTEALLISATQSLESMEVLFEQKGGFEITDNVVIAALQNIDFLQFMLQQTSGFTISEKVLMAAAGRPEAMSLILLFRPDEVRITERVMLKIRDSTTLEIVLKQMADKVPITRRILYHAASLWPSYLELLLQYKGNEITIDEDLIAGAKKRIMNMIHVADPESIRGWKIVEAAAVRDSDVMEAVLDAPEDEFPITLSVVKQASREKAVLDVLIRKRKQQVQRLALRDPVVCYITCKYHLVRGIKRAGNSLHREQAETESI